MSDYPYSFNCDDEDYNNSGVDHSQYFPLYGEEKESNFTLDRAIECEKEKRVKLYRKRADKGLDIFNGSTLPLSDLIATRGLGNLPLRSAFKQLTAQEQNRYPREKKYFEKSMEK